MEKENNKRDILSTQNTNQNDSKSTPSSNSASKVKRLRAQTESLQAALREKAISVVQVPEAYRVPANILQKIRESKRRDSTFDPTQIIRLVDAPAFLTVELNAELGFTTAKLLKIAKALDPRIVIDIEGEIF